MKYGDVDMKFCVACGHKRENNEQKFCLGCGSSLSKGEMNQDTGASPSVKQVNVKKPLTQKQKKWYMIGSLFLIVFIAFYFIGNHLTSDTRLINRFSDALREKDAVKLGEMVSFTNGDQKIGENHARAFLSLLDEYPEERQETIEELERQSMENDWGTDDYAVSIVKGDVFLFFDTYELVMEPIYVILHTNVEDAKLFVGDVEVATSDATDYSYEYGPIVMGNYTFRAEMNNEYVDLETVEEVIITRWENLESIYLTMDATYIEFNVEDLGKLDARLIINDNVIAYNFLEEGEFGPILAEETKVSAEVDFPWGTMTSEPDYPYDYYSLKFSLNEDMQVDITQEIASFHKKYWEGWQKNNTSEFIGLADEFIDRIENDFSYYHSDDYYTFARQSVSAEMDIQNIEISYVDGNYRLFVNIMEEYKEDSYYDPAYDNLMDRTGYYQIEMRYDDGWKLYDLYDYYNATIEDPLVLGLSDDLYLINVKEKNEEEVEEQDTETTNSDNHLEIQNSVLNYIEYLVNAINVGNYELVEPYIKDGSALHGMQVDLVDRLVKNGTTQEVIAASVEEIKENGSNWTVTANETIKIIYESGKEETKSYVWNYTVEAVDNEFVLTNIESAE